MTFEAANPPERIALAWYDREQWELLRDRSIDPEELDSSFDEWELNAVQAECELRARGIEVLRVPVTAQALSSWCKSRNRPLNRAARAAFVAHLFRLQSLGGKV